MSSQAEKSELTSNAAPFILLNSITSALTSDPPRLLMPPDQSEDPCCYLSTSPWDFLSA